MKPALCTAGDPRPRSVGAVTFDSLITGEENLFPFSVARAFLGKDAPPRILYLYGPEGCGKTSLLRALENEAVVNGCSRVNYTTAERFFVSFRSAIESKTTDKFKLYYRSLEFLFLDNVEFCGNKPVLQEEIVNTIDRLVERGSGVVLAGLLPPKALPNVSGRLLSRLCWGMQAQIKSPSSDSALKLITRRLENAGFSLDEESERWLASAGFESYREVEGAAARIESYFSFYADRPSTGFLKSLIADIGPSPGRVALSRIIEAVSTVSSVPVGDIVGPSRRKEVADARAACAIICRELNGSTYAEISRGLGRKSPLAAWKSVKRGRAARAVGRLVMSARGLLSSGR